MATATLPPTGDLAARAQRNHASMVQVRQELEQIYLLQRLIQRRRKSAALAQQKFVASSLTPAERTRFHAYMQEVRAATLIQARVRSLSARRASQRRRARSVPSPRLPVLLRS